MKIKTYVVSSLSEAVDQIKKDLGPSAVILSTRKLPGSEGWWSREAGKLEVTAAIDHPDSPPSPSDADSSEGKTLRVLTQMTDEKILPLREEIKRLRELLTAMPAQPVIKTPEPTAVFQKSLSPKPSAQKSAPVDTVTLSSHSSQKEKFSDSSNPIVTVCQELLWQGIRPRAVQELANHLLKEGKKISQEEAREQAAVWFLERLPETVSYTALAHPPRMIAVVGPTGSGKTTTLVKLASHLTLERNKSVAFITLDHFRIGAEDQLKKYADILKAPCELAATDQQFQDLLSRFSGKDIILIDTTGRSPNDRDGILEIGRRLQTNPSIWTALTLPVSLQDPELSNTIRQFRSIPCQSLIMTKLDEGLSFGSLFNAPHASRLPLSYFTTGQKVPEDLEEAKKERILDCLLNFSGDFSIPEEWKEDRDIGEWSFLKGDYHP